MAEILIVEDELSINELIRRNLSLTGHHCTQAFDGLSAAGLLENERFDLVVLDIMLPGLDGYQVFERAFGTPTIFLTAKSELSDKLKGLAMGADDYLTKPFSINELMARVNSLIRRYTLLNPVSGLETDCMTFQGMTIDNLNRLVLMNGVQVELTGKEFDLLSFLASNKGKVFTKKQIYIHVWQEEYAFDDSNIMSFISKLRKKIEPDPEHPFYILTVRGVGYRFNGEA